MENKELKKYVVKALIALFILGNINLDGSSVVFVSLLIIYLAISTYKYFTKNKKEKSKWKMSDEEVSLKKDIADYLQNHEQIVVNDNITLKFTKDDKDIYKRLGVFFYGEYVCQLLDFRSYDIDTYQTILESMNFAEKTTEAEPEQLKAETFIERINEYNTDIKHEEISNYLYLTSSLLTNIAVLEAKGVSDSSKTRKLYMYYLPILMDILDNYCNMKDNKYVATDIKAMEEKLIKTIILCNEALKTLLTSLNEEDILNMSVNMSTLESILKKDGLIKTTGMEKVKESVK